MVKNPTPNSKFHPKGDGKSVLCLQVLPKKKTVMQELRCVSPLRHRSVNHLMDTLWEYLELFIVKAFKTFPAGLNGISAAAVKD